jgi:hypothetical protein
VDSEQLTHRASTMSVMSYGRCIMLFIGMLMGGGAQAMNPKQVFPQDPLAQQMAAAAQRGDIARLQKLQADGGNVKVNGLKDLTLPHFALYAPNPDTLVWLIQQGADPISRLPNNATVPHYAVAKEEGRGKPTAAWISPPSQAGCIARSGGNRGGLHVVGARHDPSKPSGHSRAEGRWGEHEPDAQSA